jgi:hypothetical protein
MLKTMRLLRLLKRVLKTVRVDVDQVLSTRLNLKSKSFRGLKMRVGPLNNCKRGREMEAAASLYYLSLFDLIQTTKYIG